MVKIIFVILVSTFAIATAVFVSLGLSMPKIRRIESNSNPRFVTFDQGKIRVEITGKGLESVIFLHGFNGSLEQWDPIWKLLSDCRGRRIRLDIPGFGMSTWQSTDYSLARQSERLLMLMERLNVTRATLVGNSMGASLAAWFAASYPEKTRAVLLLAPSGSTGGLGYGGLFGFFTSNRLGHFLGRKISKMNLFKLIFPNRLAIQTLETSASYGRQWDEKLRAIQSPVWIGWSATDQIARAETAPSVQRLIPQSKLEWLSWKSSHELIMPHAKLIANRICTLHFQPSIDP